MTSELPRISLVLNFANIKQIVTVRVIRIQNINKDFEFYLFMIHSHTLTLVSFSLSGSFLQLFKEFVHDDVSCSTVTHEIL